MDEPDNNLRAWKDFREELEVCPLMGSKMLLCLAKLPFSEGLEMEALS